ncbi:MAG: hypothetical protein H7323_01090 [Frankiales bacterium]|nr:hypothetical protein [Frankiales bacterium]
MTDDVESNDRSVPSPRRPGLPSWLRGASTTEPVTPQPAPRVADLSALLADIDALRTTLSTDLSLAAAALEAGADDLAGELVSGDLVELHAFQTRALTHLAALQEPEPAGEATVAPVSRRRRMMPAAPLVAAAAAAIGLFAGVVPNSSPAPQPSATVDGLSQAGFSVAWLSTLAAQGASPAELREAAQSMNAELTDLVAEAGTNPAAAQQALLLLQAGTQVLSDQGDQGVLREVLARTRELERQLRKVLPAISRSAAPIPSRPGLPGVQRPAPQTEPARTQRPTASSTPSSSAPASPRPTSSPSPTGPSPAPTPTTAPAPGSSPSPSDGPLPRPPGLPGS